MTGGLLKFLRCGIAAALLPGIVVDQSAYGQSVPDDRPLSVPISGLQTGTVVLAPQADRLGKGPTGDRTPTLQLPDAALPDADIALPATPSTPSTAPDDAAAILADNLVLQNDKSLIAGGGVVVLYRGSRLVASRLIVDGASGGLTIEGPVRLSRPSTVGPGTGDILVADSAQLDKNLQDGIIRGARLLLARELQIAANSVVRSNDGRFTKLSRVAASSCKVCAINPTPLWEIRARTIIHDADLHRLHIDHPQFRAFGMPIAYLPFEITAPDPTISRLSGFLRPETRTTSGLGFGIKVPYFLTLGPSADLTITPYLAASYTRTLGLRYRHAFSSGVMQWEGAVSRDDIRRYHTRGYLFGNGFFRLPRGYSLGLQVQLASDRGYLLDYDISDADRLWSGVTLERFTRNRLVFARIGNYYSLREDEDNSTSPSQIADVVWQRRFIPRLIGGEGMMGWSLHGHRRSSDENIIGRDIGRASVSLDWRRTEILPGGVVAAGLLGLDADLYRIIEDDRYDIVSPRLTPKAGVELRWPLATSAGNVTHIVEPVAQILWSPDGNTGDIPNEDSTLIEFDEGNLFSDSRFPGYDAREGGPRANLGVSWTQYDLSGWSIGLTGGRVFRLDSDKQFADTSPLGGRRSDWLLSTRLDNSRGFAIADRALIDDSFNVSRNELRLGWLHPEVQLSMGHLWIARNSDEGRTISASELTTDLGWQIAPGWWGSTETRYDFKSEKAQKAALEVTYSNECISVELAVSRRFTGSNSVKPETNFDLSVRLGGFGKQRKSPGTVAQHSCMR